MINEIQKLITEAAARGENVGQLTDTYHSFDEYFNFRMIYNALLFNEWAKNYDPKLSGLDHDGEFTNYAKVRPHYNVHKSWNHHDGEPCFGGGWFIVSAKLPTGLISNHYEAKHWDLFKIPEVEKALFEYDGHTAQDVFDRLLNIAIQ